MTQYSIPQLEKLAQYLDAAANRSSREMQNVVQFSGQDIRLRSPIHELNLLFDALAAGKTTFSSLIREGLQEGVSGSYLENVAQQCRYTALEQMVDIDRTGDKALDYLQERVLAEPTLKGKLDWISVMEHYSVLLRTMRDKDFKESVKASQSIDSVGLRGYLVPASTPHRLFEMASSQYDALLEEPIEYRAREALVRVMGNIGSVEAISKLVEIAENPAEHRKVKELAVKLSA